MIKFISRLDLNGSRIDRETGIIKGVSLIAIGDARGHNKAVDQKTLETVRDCAKQYHNGLRVKFNPTTFTHGAGSLAGTIPASTIRIEGGKTVGDMHLYKALPSEIKDYLFEIAEETPGNIGLSIEFSGDDETIDDNKFARCSEIFAATIVDLPAANPTGLFAAGADGNVLTTCTKLNKTNPTEEKPMDEETIKKLSTGIAAGVVAGLKPLIKQAFQAGNGNEDDEKQEMAAAGVTDEDDEATKKQKLADFRATQSKPVSEMSAGELAGFISRTNMQFFRTTGNRPAKVSAGGGDIDATVDPFEKRVRQHMEAGAKSRGLAINRARRDAPKEYNVWMAKSHPGVQHMAQK